VASVVIDQREGPERRWHRGITMHAIPVVGVGGLIFAIGVVLIFTTGVPGAKWFLIGSLPVGLLALMVIRLVHKLRPKTEEEEVQLNVGRQA
jgi:hypothetical protein